MLSLEKICKKSIKEMIIIEMSWENNDVNFFCLYNKIERATYVRNYISLKI